MPRLRVLLFCLAVALTVRAPLARAEVTAEEVRQAIDGGVEYLLDQQRPDGSWLDYSGARQVEGGPTALITLALIESGVPVEDPHIQGALAHLRQLPQPRTVYGASLHIMVFAVAEPENDRLLIRRNAVWLEQAQRKDGDCNGAWHYYLEGNHCDNSSTQFAIMALHEAERVGIEVSDSTWRRCMRYWIKSQNPDGSWGYGPGQTPSTRRGSMTCAGIASLVMAAGRFSRDASERDGQIVCCGADQNDLEDQELADEALESVDRGLAWVGQNFAVSRNPGVNVSGLQPRSFIFYYLYALERVGRMTGERFIVGRGGTHYDWYREGAEHLVAIQDRINHLWVGEGYGEERAELATSMALLFLAKGRRPVLIAKLDHDRQSNDWNLHRGDLARLTAHVEGLWDQNLTWQTVDIEAASASDLLQAPVLFLNGREALALTDRDKADLKTYIESGGFLLAAANDGGDEFDRSFRELMVELFPHSELRPLPADHPIWFAQQPVDLDPLPELWGLDACCRTSVVYCPATHQQGRLRFDLSCRWELAGPRTDYLPEIQQEVEAAMAIGANIVAYATGRELRYRLDVPGVVDHDDSNLTRSRGTLRVAMIANGDANEAPNALPNLLGVFQRETEMSASTPREPVSLESPSLPEYPVLFMHGRRDFRFTPLERRRLAEFIENGGVLFADAICANGEFAEAFRRELRAVLPEGRLERIPVEHPLFTSEFRGDDLSTVTLRDPRLRREGESVESRLSQVTPVLEGIEIDGRYVVIFSPNDISCALETGVSLECKGYVREDAARLGINVLLYALQQ